MFQMEFNHFFMDKIEIGNSCKFLKKNEIINLPIFLFLTSQQNIMTFQFLGFFRIFQQSLCPFGKVVFGFFDLWKWRRNHLVKKRTFLRDCSQAFKSVVFDLASGCRHTVATDELLCLKNAGIQISIFFTSN